MQAARWTRLVAGLAIAVAVAVLAWRREAEDRAPLLATSESSSTDPRDREPAATGIEGIAPPIDRDPVAPPPSRPSCPLVTVRTLTSDTRPKPVGGIPFAVGFGQGRDPAALPVARGVTDANGTAEVALPADAFAAALAANERIWGRVESEGRARSTLAIELSADRSPELLLRVLDGFSVAGRVVDSSGVPVRARVWTWYEEKSGSRRGIDATSDADGWFELWCSKILVRDLVATAEGVGTTLVADVALAPVSDPLELVLNGPGELHGRVLDPSGTPVAGLELDAVAETLGADFNAFRHEEFDEPRFLYEQPASAGHLFASTRTDLEGRFAFTGLAGGGWWIRNGFEWEPTVLHEAPIPSSGPEVVLTVQRSHLVVRVHDLEGRVETPDEARPRWTEAAQWPETPQVLVVPEGLAEWGGESRPIESSVVGDARVFQVVAGRRYQVGLVGGAEPWRPVAVVAAPGRVEVGLRRSPELGTGTVTIDATDADGAPLTKAFELRVEDPESDVVVQRWTSSYRFASWPRTLTLPTGTWRIAVEGHAVLDGMHFTLSERRTLGRFETLVRVREGETHAIHATLPAGARLRLTLAGVAKAEELQPDRLWVRPERVAYVTLALHQQGRRPVPVLFEHDTPFAPLQPFLALGTTADSDPLPSGRWTLEGRLGERIARTTVDLVDGATTEATLRFE